MPNCPSCEEQSLLPIQPLDGLVARQCASCEGMLLDLLVYRQWRESSAEALNQHQLSAEPQASGDSQATPEDTKQALLCPGCSRIMTKYRVTGELANRFDFCVHCSDVWMDVGELELLNTTNLQGDLARIFTQPWQRQLVSDQQAQMGEANLASHLGSDLSKVEDFAGWLVAHAERTRIFAYLRARLRAGDED